MPDVTSRDLQLEKSAVDERTYRLKPGEKIPEDEASSGEEDEEEDEKDDDEDDDDEEEEDGKCENDGPVKESEQLENKSAAALCIQVGSFSDPPEAQGLSHFLEHMVFMGSSKYPSENDFDAYLSRRGGQCNAWTGNEYTLFHFDVKRKHFTKCLDRFAHFFISPLLQKDSTDRELAAVHSEFELCNVRDSSRLTHFIATLASESSPFRIFGWGNMKALREIPEQNGTDIYSLLQKHCHDHYSAHRMTLTLHCKDTLDNTETLVRNLFSAVPNTGVAAPNFSSFANSFDNSSFTKFYRVCPLGDREKLRVLWSLPATQPDYASAPIPVISSLVGHEGQGSVLALLKEKNLAVSLSCGISPTSDFENSSLCTLFIVHITLTDEGRDNVNEVCRILFVYFKMLLLAAREISTTTADAEKNGSTLDNAEATSLARIRHTFHSYLLEYQLAHEAAFRYSESDEPQETSIHVANMLQLVPMEHVYSAYYILKKIDLPMYIKVLELLIPSRACIILLSGKFATTVAAEKTELEIEPWFKLRYQAEATNFDLLPSSEDMKVPIDLNDTPAGKYRKQYGQLWFQQCTRFKAPKACFVMHLWSPLVTKSRENMALQMILNYSLNQTLSTIAYEGGEANLGYNLEYTESGLKIGLTGFNEKLFCFYKVILDHIMSDQLDISAAHFESYRESIRQLCFNESLKPKILNSHLLFFLLRKDAYLFDDVLAAIQNLSVADLFAYKRRFFSRLRLTAYAHGNMSAEDAFQLFDYTTTRTGCNPLPQRKFSDVAALEPGVYGLRVMSCNPADVNTCVSHVHMLGKTDLKRNTYNQLLAYILSEPAFDFLRTKETLGYQVYLRNWRSSPGGNLHSGISVVSCSQANQFSTSHVSGRLASFWYRISPRILAAMTPAAFQTSVDSLVTIKQLEDPNMLTEVDRNWDEILFGECMFNRREASINILRTVKKEDLMNFFVKEYLEPKNQRTLMIQVDGPKEVDPNYVQPQKSYGLHIRHVELLEPICLEEQTSADEVDVAGAVKSCGFECELASDFFRKSDSKLDSQDFCPSLAKRQCIDNVRTFRSKLSYDDGRVVV